MPKINTHQGHVASCLCCIYFELTAQGLPYSDFTPGDSATIECKKRVFDMIYSPEQEDMHKVINLGQTCEEFQNN